eukprot:scaffold58572_cov42-Phaeocystis_antarctica.AAC.2
MQRAWPPAAVRRAGTTTTTTTVPGRPQHEEEQALLLLLLLCLAARSTRKSRHAVTGVTGSAEVRSQESPAPRAWPRIRRPRAPWPGDTCVSSHACPRGEARTREQQTWLERCGVWVPCGRARGLLVLGLLVLGLLVLGLLVLGLLVRGSRPAWRTRGSPRAGPRGDN